MSDNTARVIAVSAKRSHKFSKDNQLSIRLVAGIGVIGDAHAGETVKHRSRAMYDPTQRNLRQVHLIPVELLDDLRQRGFTIAPGAMGENITTRGLALLDLPVGTRLHLGEDAVVEVTGLRNPCIQMDRFQSGLMAATLDRDSNGKLIRKAGVMSIVLAGGDVLPGAAIRIELPSGPHKALDVV